MKNDKIKTIVNVIGLLIFIALFIISLIYILPNIKSYIEDPRLFRDYIKNNQEYGIIIFLLFQILQVIVFIIPGEFIEIASGISFGWFGGFVLCEIGIFIASSFILFFSRKIGKPVITSFIGESKFTKFEKINQYVNRDKIIFLIFLIPGLPKDILLYISSFFDISWKKLMILTLVARIPSIITSTIAGEYILKQQYLRAIIVFVVTGIATLVCYLTSNKILMNLQKKKDE